MMREAAREKKTLWDALRLLRASADHYARLRLALALLLVIAAGIVAACTPMALQKAIDTLTGAARNADSSLSFVYLGLYVAGLYVARIFTELRLRTYGHGEQRLRRRISRRLFDHLLRLPLCFHLEHKTGALTGSAEQGQRGFELVLQHLVLTMLPVSVELIMVACVLTYLGHVTYILLLALALLAYTGVFQRGAADIRGPSETGSAVSVEARGLLGDSLANCEAVKCFVAEATLDGKYDSILSRAETAMHQFYNRRAANGYLLSTIFAAAIAAASLRSAYEVTRASMTVGDFILINAYFLRLVQPLEQLGFAIRDIMQGLAFLQSMLALFSEPPEGGTQARCADPPQRRGELVFSHVSFSYRPDRPILRDVTFTARPGQTIAIVGRSGAGKSSLVRLLLGLNEPTSGAIVIDGAPLSSMRLHDVRRLTAVVPQDTALFHDTIANNIALGRPGAALKEIEAAARLASLHDAILLMPEGYDTMVGARGLKLSGGERQRVAIARAALLTPAIYVFDEATSSLDTRTERDILQNLRALSGHCTTLVIAHRLSTVIHADEIIVLQHGVIVERGKHGELMRARGHYESLYHAQQSERIEQDETISI